MWSSNIGSYYQDKKKQPHINETISQLKTNTPFWEAFLHFLDLPLRWFRVSFLYNNFFFTLTHIHHVLFFSSLRPVWGLVRAHHSDGQPLPAGEGDPQHDGREGGPAVRWPGWGLQPRGLAAARLAAHPQLQVRPSPMKQVVQCYKQLLRVVSVARWWWCAVVK